ncbi:MULTISPECIES: response regulator transcription factor [Proteus]|jgi:two-component system uhpT operon response regulator UhpA|uniref:Two-component response regulator n=1 Tax=Proteus vulgaris TaxID=585 RepID=A0A379F6E4_PROVU|nr:MULTISPECIES: response regulator transcription factor [Proteus]NBN59771.1 response regulator [Proteus sp. G2639]RNT26216.1 DNA-binding response regulator [Proteus mirabilis]AYY79640.1 DNA-binding response regulator [Proteus vulgaris]KGA56421.1 bacterial regulatory s, luxR family protein [Proteus vulgaris]MBG5970745.1 response regulator transcription factor [Proteus vulgaris]
MIKVALVDDHIVVRSGFAQLLMLEPDIHIVGEYSNGQEAWPYLAHDDIDVAVMDLSMPGESGLQLQSRLKQKRPDFRTIILSIYDTPAFVQSALDSGAHGYLTKRCGPEELVQAVRAVHQGGCYLCADAMKALRHTPEKEDALHTLTPREKEIFNLLVQGVNVKTIAIQLNLSHKTVHVHRANVLGKLSCETTIDLVHFALKNQLITGSL